MDQFVLKDCRLFNAKFEDALSGIKNEVDVILTSPPYNIGSKKPKVLGDRKNGVSDPKSWGAIEGYEDGMDENDYQKSQANFLLFCSKMIKDDGVIIYNHKPRHKNGQLIHPYKWFPKELVLHEEIIWNRGSTHNHCPHFCFPQSERIYVFKKFIDSKIYFSIEDDGTDSRSDVWYVPPGKNDEFSKKHNAPFPLEIARRCLLRWGKPGGLVCDPYSGSGTTMIASQKMGFKFVGSENLTKYFELSCKRLRSYL